MRTRRWAQAGLVGLAAFAVGVLCWPRGPHPCRATFEQVREGMTRSEVESVVGGPPGNYFDRPEIPLVVSGITNFPERWVAHDSNLIVYFDNSGVARAVYVTNPSPDDRSPAQKLRDRLGF